MDDTTRGSQPVQHVELRRHHDHARAGSGVAPVVGTAQPAQAGDREGEGAAFSMISDPDIWRAAPKVGEGIDSPRNWSQSSLGS